MLRFSSFAANPGVAELADAADSKSAGALLRVGSTPSSGTLLFCFSEKITKTRINTGYFNRSTLPFSATK
jgi:hypothetical protein